jgi:hypothetical protein
MKYIKIHFYSICLYENENYKDTFIKNIRELDTKWYDVIVITKSAQFSFKGLCFDRVLELIGYSDIEVEKGW